MSYDDRSHERATRPIVTVLISRSASQLTDFLRVADDRNVKVIPFPLHTIEPTIDRLDPQIVANDLQDCSWLLFTSANSAIIYFDFLRKNEITVPANVAIGAIGKKTAHAVARYGLQVAICPTDEVAEGLLNEVLRVTPERDHCPGCRGNSTGADRGIGGCRISRLQARYLSQCRHPTQITAGYCG
jgi:uroporphyrinogen-III synthase